METLKIVLMFYNLAVKKAKKYADKLFGYIPKGGLIWKGAVSYYSNLPDKPAEGDCYTVKYTGESGSKVDGTEYVWGSFEGTAQWIPVGPDISTKADRVSGATAGNLAALDADGNMVDSGIDPTSIPTGSSVSVTVENNTFTLRI